MKITKRTVAFVASCMDCKTDFEDAKEGDYLAEKHADRTNHRVAGFSISVVSFDGRPVPNESKNGKS